MVDWYIKIHALTLKMQAKALQQQSLFWKKLHFPIRSAYKKLKTNRLVDNVEQNFYGDH